MGFQWRIVYISMGSRGTLNRCEISNKLVKMSGEVLNTISARSRSVLIFCYNHNVWAFTPFTAKTSLSLSLYSLFQQICINCGGNLDVLYYSYIRDENAHLLDRIYRASKLGKNLMLRSVYILYMAMCNFRKSTPWRRRPLFANTSFIYLLWSGHKILHKF